jgi:biopolymer transport protein ExbB/TolQ
MLNTFISLLENLLFSISSFLYLPVLLAVSALLLYLLLASGALLREWLERRRGIFSLAAYGEAQMVAHLAGSAEELAIHLEQALQQAEARGLQQLDAVRFAVRLGPALGLMGTLIPMGIALSGLAQGNMPEMAHSMVNAFTATVIGLACSVLAFLLALVREHWLRHDLNGLALLAERCSLRQQSNQAELPCVI